MISFLNTAGYFLYSFWLTLIGGSEEVRLFYTVLSEVHYSDRLYLPTGGRNGSDTECHSSNEYWQHLPSTNQSQ